MEREQFYERLNIDIPSMERKKYSRAKAQAKFRKDEWAFTVDTWYKMWLESGVIEHRGKEPHQYCMVRLDPIEAWGPHNCIIVPRRMHLKKVIHDSLWSDKKSQWQRHHGVSK